jgi:ATP-dependent Lon protease
LVETEDTYWAELTNTQLSYVNIDETLVNRYEKLLAGGVWAIVELKYDSERFVKGVLRPFVIKSIKPIQLISQGLNELEEKRSQFSREEWIDFIIRSIGLEPLSFSHRLKMLMICRLIPLVESNYNLVELGPRGTGKSYVYRDISPYCILVSGGETTVPSLFVSHVGKGRVGLVGIWDTVAFDEVAGLTKLKDAQAVQILKDYMESGSFSRGKEQVNALASLVFVGNIDFDIVNILRNSHLFVPFPAEMQDAAFLDRFHAYLPGWEIPKTHPSFFGAHYGFVVDHLAEFLRELRKITFANALDDHFRLGNTITRRDEKAIRKTVSGLIKILHPDGQYSREELEEYLQLAMELRRRVKEQLKKIGGIEFYDTHFTYVSLGTNTPIEVTVPEQESLTPVKPQTEPKVGEVLGLAISQSYGTIQKFEVIATEGTGRLIPLGSMMRVMRESLRAAYEYISRNQKNLGITVDFKKEYDISVLAMQMGIPKEGASAGITILTALVSALTKKPVRHDIAMTGEITLKGKIAGVDGIQEKLVAAAEAGIRKAYIPKENRREYEALPQKVKDSLEVQLVENVEEVLNDAMLEYEINISAEQRKAQSKARMIIEQGENERVEFKSSLRWDYKQNTKNQSLETVVAKSIAALLNYDGGTLLVGVDDSKNILGLENDFSTL